MYSEYIETAIDEQPEIFFNFEENFLNTNIIDIFEYSSSKDINYFNYNNFKDILGKVLVGSVDNFIHKYPKFLKKLENIISIEDNNYSENDKLLTNLDILDSTYSIFDLFNFYIIYTKTAFNEPYEFSEYQIFPESENEDEYEHIEDHDFETVSIDSPEIVYNSYTNKKKILKDLELPLSLNKNFNINFYNLFFFYKNFNKKNYKKIYKLDKQLLSYLLDLLNYNKIINLDFNVYLKYIKFIDKSIKINKNLFININNNFIKDKIISFLKIITLNTNTNVSNITNILNNYSKSYSKFKNTQILYNFSLFYYFLNKKIKYKKLYNIFKILFLKDFKSYIIKYILLYNYLIKKNQNINYLEVYNDKKLYKFKNNKLKLLKIFIFYNLNNLTVGGYNKICLQKLKDVFKFNDLNLKITKYDFKKNTQKYNNILLKNIHKKIPIFFLKFLHVFENDTTLIEKQITKKFIIGKLKKNRKIKVENKWLFLKKIKTFKKFFKIIDYISISYNNKKSFIKFYNYNFKIPFSDNKFNNFYKKKKMIIKYLCNFDKNNLFFKINNMDKKFKDFVVFLYKNYSTFIEYANNFYNKKILYDVQLKKKKNLKNIFIDFFNFKYFNLNNIDIFKKSNNNLLIVDYLKKVRYGIFKKVKKPIKNYNRIYNIQLKKINKFIKKTKNKHITIVNDLDEIILDKVFEINKVPSINKNEGISIDTNILLFDAFRDKLENRNPINNKNDLFGLRWGEDSHL